jgi:hypothetical protein
MDADIERTVESTERTIEVHLHDQEDVPEGFVKLDTGEIVPLGGSQDNGDD